MINGAHTLIYTRDPEAARVFFRDVLGFASVDVGHGWLIFRLPPAEVAAHPLDDGMTGDRHEMYLMCDDIDKTVEEMRAKGAEFTAPVSDQGWGVVTRVRIPGGGDIGLYQPRHALPPDWKAPRSSSRPKKASARKKAPGSRVNVKKKTTTKKKTSKAKRRR